MREEIYTQVDKKNRIPAEGAISLVVDGKTINRANMLIDEDKNIITGCIINKTFYYSFNSKQGKGSTIKVYYQN